MCPRNISMNVPWVFARIISFCKPLWHYIISCASRAFSPAPCVSARVLGCCMCAAPQHISVNKYTRAAERRCYSFVVIIVDLTSCCCCLWMAEERARDIFHTLSRTENSATAAARPLEYHSRCHSPALYNIYLQMHRARTHKAEKHRLWKSSQTRGGCRQKQFSSFITIETQCAFFTRNKTTNEILSNTGVTGGK